MQASPAPATLPSLRAIDRRATRHRARYERFGAWLAKYPRHPKASRVERLRERARLSLPAYVLPSPDEDPATDVARVGDRVLVVHALGRAVLYEGQRERRSWNLPLESAACVAAPGDGALALATGGGRGCVFATAGDRPSRTLELGVWIRNVEASPVDALVAVTGFSSEARESSRCMLVDLKEASVAHQRQGLGSPFESLAFAADGKTLLVGYGRLDKTKQQRKNGVRRWTVPEFAETSFPQVEVLGLPSAVTFLPGEETFFVGTNAGQLARHDATTGEILQRLRASHVAERIEASRSGKREDDRQPTLHEIAGDAAAHVGTIRSLQVLGDDWFLSAGARGSSGSGTKDIPAVLRYWSKEGENVFWVELPSAPKRVCVLPGPKMLAILFEEPLRVEVWPLASPEFLAGCESP